MVKPDSDFHNGHRERLRQKFLDAKLSDAEKLELMLGYIIPRRDVRVLSHRLIDMFGNISGILTADIDKLQECDGVGRNTAIFIKLIHTLMIDGYKYHLASVPFFHSQEVLHNYCLMLFANKPIEEVHILFLDHDFRLLQDWTHAQGSVSQSNIYPREIVQRALSLGARSLIMVHNHPSLTATFSTDDARVTQVLANVLHGVGVELHDHLLIACGKVMSAKNQHIYNPPSGEQEN